MAYFQVGARVRLTPDNPRIAQNALSVRNADMRGKVTATHPNVGGRPVWVVLWDHPVQWPNRPEAPFESSHYQHLLTLDVDPNSFQGRVMSYIDREINNVS